MRGFSFLSPSEMDDVEREPCPRCGEPAAIGGRVCPHCHGTLFVDLVADAIADPRARYRAARDLSRLGCEIPPLLRVQELLAIPGSVVGSQMTREVARKALAILEANGGRGRLVAREEIEPPIAAPQYEEEFRPARLRERLVFLLPMVLVGAALFFFLRLRPRPVAVVSPASPSPAETSGPARSTPAPRDLVSRALESTASVACPASGGAGFFLTPELLVTNDHVLCGGGAAPEVVLRDGRRLKGEIRLRDDWLDLALLRVPGASARPLPLGDATRAAAGDPVLMIGNPLGMGFTVSRTIISHTARDVYGIAYLQFDGNVNPGNSGGPLLDADGRAIGVVSMMVKDARGLGLALPVNYLFELHSTDIPLPIPAPNFSGWKALLAEVRRDEQREIESARAAFRKPGLAGASIGPDGETLAIVVSRGMPAGATPLYFELRQNDRLVCRANGIVETWGFWTRRPDDSGQDSRRLRWLQKTGIASDLYVGTAVLHMDACPDGAARPGAQLVLREADPGFDRAILRPMREMQ